MITRADAAVAYAEARIAVFRLEARSKKPLAHTAGFKDAVVSPAAVAAWWRSRPQCNVGIATGAVSGFWVFDIDGAGGDAALAALEAQHGALPVTPEQSTGKGRHICFAWDPARPVRNMSKKSRERIGEEIDVRGDGGYIVAPPSIHPSGRVYAWIEGRSPHQIPFAPAPAWLLDLVSPIEEAAAPAAPRAVAPRVRDGRASKYGEKALDNACREIATAPAGRQNDTLYQLSCGIGRLVAGGEIEAGYARPALVDAGLSMRTAGKPWTQKQIDDMVARAFEWAVAYPKAAPALERASSRAASDPTHQLSLQVAAPAGDLAEAVVAARRLWDTASPAWCADLAAWLSARGLEPRPDCAEDILRAFRMHPAAPWGRDRAGPALLAPLAAQFDGGADALAVLPLHPRCERFTHFIGESAGKALFLGDLGGPLLVTVDLQDAWALAQLGHSGLIAVVPRRSSFAGGALGDTFGRVDPLCPRADPNRPAWTMAGPPKVLLAVRRDLRTPPLKVRGPGGKSQTVELQGEAAARWFGSLAEQHWRAAGANDVRAIVPAGASGFNSFYEQRGAA